MKNYILLLLFIASFPVVAQDAKTETQSETTTYYLIRHAEKDRSDAENKNPALTEDGQKRAQNWSKVFEKVDFDIVYCTNYNRTLQTAAPTAMDQGVEVKAYLPNKLYDKSFRKDTQGKTVLVVGHSNTTPAFVNAILGESRYESMSDDDNGSLFIVTVMGDQKNVQVLSIN